MQFLVMSTKYENIAGEGEPKLDDAGKKSVSEPKPRSPEEKKQRFKEIIERSRRLSKKASEDTMKALGVTPSNTSLNAEKDLNSDDRGTKEDDSDSSALLPSPRTGAVCTRAGLDDEGDFCAPNLLWGLTGKSWRKVFCFVAPLLHVMFTAQFLYGSNPVGNHPRCLAANLSSPWPTIHLSGNYTNQAKLEIQEQLGKDFELLERSYGGQNAYARYLYFVLVLGCLHLVLGSWDLMLCGRPNGGVFSILWDCLLECFCGCTRHFVCADDFSGHSDRVFCCDRRGGLCRTTCLCCSPVIRAVRRFAGMVWLLPRWSIMIGAGSELVANTFFMLETPGLIGTNCFFLRIAAIAAIVVNAALNGNKLRQRVSYGSTLLPEEAAHIIDISQAHNPLRPKIRGTGLFYCC